MTKPRRVPRTDGEATRRKLLEAAGGLFAENGFAETTNKAVAKCAEADIASINYHFGSRAGLYRAVLFEAHRRLISLETLENLHQSGMEPRDKLRALIEGLVSGTAGTESWHGRVLAREILSPSSHMQALKDQEIAGKLRIVLAIFSDITGISPDNPELLRCALSVFAPCVILLVARRALPFPAQGFELSRRELAEHFYQFALGGMSAIKNAGLGEPS
ncbi:CerR family C-terminal domain-containing protein [Paracoccus sp. MBLB3053]|uniref:CerR family C-terminal domain-containing protein n=1 Tax=Paracoccus aurantius TaxID=3073814 RepID=A0ABU2HYT5_9RHOB|nr:CerR family C-terminal domain-containing protein [Paracoccus sp. MBLB3053]MDS9469444.1 CerR family C-terminal domain-containing protein [Paracoccus sp. MBLB3053]